jgi:hypothetical protein
MKTGPVIRAIRATLRRLWAMSRRIWVQRKKLKGCQNDCGNDGEVARLWTLIGADLPPLKAAIAARMRPSFEARLRRRAPQDEARLLQQNQPHPEVPARFGRASKD